MLLPPQGTVLLGVLLSWEIILTIGAGLGFVLAGEIRLQWNKLKALENSYWNAKRTVRRIWPLTPVVLTNQTEDDYLQRGVAPTLYCVTAILFLGLVAIYLFGQVLRSGWLNAIYLLAFSCLFFTSI